MLIFISYNIHIIDIIYFLLTELWFDWVCLNWFVKKLVHFF